MKIFNIIILITLFGCERVSNCRVIDLKEFPLQTLLAEYTSIELIKSFPCFQECSSKIITANAYLCLNGSDTIVVLDPCHPFPNFARNDYQFHDDLDLIINKKDVIVKFSEKMNVAKNVPLRKNTKIIVASLTSLEY